MAASLNPQPAERVKRNHKSNKRTFILPKKWIHCLDGSHREKGRLRGLFPDIKLPFFIILRVDQWILTFSNAPGYMLGLGSSYWCRQAGRSFAAGSNRRTLFAWRYK